MKAIILAAGLGSRLGSLTRDVPKAAIVVSGSPPIARAVRFANQIKLDQVVVVGGFNSRLVWDALDGFDVERLEYPEYRKGNFYTLDSAINYLDGDFVLMNVDHLYPSHLARMVSETGDGIWAICDFDRPLGHDDMKVRINGQPETHAEVVSISKGLDEFDGGYCGMTVVRGDGVERYKNALHNVRNHGREQAVVEDILAELIRLEDPPHVLDISGIRWLEVDTQQDLNNAERILRMKSHFLD